MLTSSDTEFARVVADPLRLRADVIGALAGQFTELAGTARVTAAGNRKRSCP
jgi:hypothetical protein